MNRYIFSVCVVLLLVAPTTPAAGDEQAARLSGEQFWALHLAFERVQVLEEDAHEMRGTFKGKHGGVSFVADKSDVYSLEAKHRGSLKALDFAISLLRYGESDQKRNAGHRQAEALTGESFQTIEGWDGWLAENRPFLFYSELEKRLCVDDVAKRAGEPVLGGL